MKLEGGGPEFGRSVNPIQTKGGRLCPSHYCQPPLQKASYTSDLSDWVWDYETFLIMFWITCIRRVIDHWGFLTAILHRGLRNWFFSGRIYFFHILSGLIFPFYLPFLFGLLFHFYFFLDFYFSFFYFYSIEVKRGKGNKSPKRIWKK